MNTDYIAGKSFHQQDHDLADRVERRRATADRAAARFGGDRLALVAYLARSARATQAAVARPAGC